MDRYLPEKAWRKIIEAHFKSKEKEPFSMQQCSLRPTRLLNEPIKLRWDSKRFLFFSQERHQKGMWKVIDTQGPERISGEWWDKAFFRDYYRVLSETGQELWVFKDQKEFYLHGYFD